MGITGAGKSTFIKTVTGIKDITIGNELEGCKLLICHADMTHELRHSRYTRGFGSGRPVWELNESS